MEAIGPSRDAIAVLRAIARAGFTDNRTKELAEAAGWKLVNGELSLGYLRFDLILVPGKDDRRPLTIFVQESGRSWAFVPLFYFDEDEEDREPFDRAYRSLVEQLTGIIDAPFKTGQYSYPHRSGWPYSYSCWSLPDATVVLVQDEFDIQFGMDVSLWILPPGVAVELPMRGE